VTKKQVWQYKCDFCGKKKYSASSMSVHEKHCTMNPGRECRMCEKLGEEPNELSALIALFPNREQFKKNETFDVFSCTFEGESYPGYDEACNKVMPELRKLSGNCPACILAAIRQSQAVVEFDYKRESESFWHDYNETNV
jgi:hypothetical protein